MQRRLLRDQFCIAATTYRPVAALTLFQRRRRRWLTNWPEPGDPAADLAERFIFQLGSRLVLGRRCRPRAGLLGLVCHAALLAGMCAPGYLPTRGSVGGFAGGDARMATFLAPAPRPSDLTREIDHGALRDDGEDQTAQGPDQEKGQIGRGLLGQLLIETGTN